MIRIKILNHEELVTEKGGVLGYVGKGLSKVGLMDLNQTVEKKIASQIETQLRQQGVKALVTVTGEDA
jgi:hypothetical protein